MHSSDQSFTIFMARGVARYPATPPAMVNGLSVTLDQWEGKVTIVEFRNSWNFAKTNKFGQGLGQKREQKLVKK